MTSLLKNILISGNAPIRYPTDVYFAILWQNDEDALEVPLMHPYSGEWGIPLSTQLSEQDEVAIPKKIDMVWLSIIERKFYSLENNLPVDQLEILFNQNDENTGEALFEYIVVGMHPMET